MSNEQNDFTKNFEGIITKTIEINKQYLKQGSELVKQLSKTNNKGKNLTVPKSDVIMGAFTAFTKLNLDHYQNIVNLGFAFFKKVVDENESSQNSSGENFKNEEKRNEEPAFILKQSVQAGTTVRLQFLLDSVKEEDVICELKNSNFINEKGAIDDTQGFKTIFQPQSFQLKTGKNQSITIDVSVDSKIKPGIYLSRGIVLGFEPAYFLIKLNVLKKPTKSNTDGRKKKK